MDTVPFVAIQTFVLASRSSGYRSTAAALSELVDNAIQASASRVRIIISPVDDSHGGSIQIAVSDNGSGMAPGTLEMALQFGGSGRFGEREGLGRFGMGLPASSVSQCQRVDVYTWKESGRVLHTYLDLDEIASGRSLSVPVPRIAELPPLIRRYAEETGTAVVWTRCDGLDCRRADTLARRLHVPLGRRFRYFLWAGLSLQINDAEVPAIDPLFCNDDGTQPGAHDACAPLQYPIRLGVANNSVSTIAVRFSTLPIEQWHNWSVESKRKAGITGGAGISIVRARREIAYGWYFMGKRRRQNYDDWWRCEVSFEPLLDEWFGVTHSKQDINPTPELLAVLTSEISAMANLLNRQIQRRFAAVRGSPGFNSVQRMEEVSRILPVSSPELRSHSPSQQGERSPGPRKYQLRVEHRADQNFVHWENTADNLHLILNANHPFYTRVYLPLRQRDLEAADMLECMLLAYARSEVLQSEGDSSSVLHNLRVDWSNTLAALLG